MQATVSVSVAWLGIGLILAILATGLWFAPVMTLVSAAVLTLLAGMLWRIGLSTARQRNADHETRRIQAAHWFDQASSTD